MAEPARIEVGQYAPHDDRPGVLVRFPYTPALIDEIKRIPNKDRRWIKYEKAWWVEEGYTDQLEELLLRYFGGLEWVDEDGTIEIHSRGGRMRQEGLF